MKLYYLRPEDVAEFWGDIEGMIADASARNSNYTADDIRKGAIERRYQIWIAIDQGDVRALAVTTVKRYPLRRVCSIMICTGKGREDWLQLLEQIEEWAKNNECAAVEPVARPGWQKVLAPKGYRMTHVVLEKEL